MIYGNIVTESDINGDFEMNLMMENLQMQINIIPLMETYINESGNDGNIVTKIIDVIKNAVKRFREWLSKKINDSLQKFKGHKFTGFGHNQLVKVYDIKNPVTEDYIKTMMQPVMITNKELKEFDQQMLEDSQYTVEKSICDKFKINSIDDISNSMFIEEIEMKNKDPKINEIKDKIQKMMKDANDISFAFSDYSNKIILNLTITARSIYNFKGLNSVPGEHKNDFVDIKYNNTNEKEAINISKQLYNIAGCYQYIYGCILKVTNSYISAIKECILHNFQLGPNKK